MSHQEVFPSVHLPVKSAVWASCRLSLLTFSHVKNWLYLFSDLLRECFQRLVPCSPCMSQSVQQVVKLPV